MANNKLSKLISDKEKELRDLRNELKKITAQETKFLKKHNADYIQSFIIKYIEPLESLEGKFFIDKLEFDNDPSSIEVFRISKVKNIKDIRSKMNKLSNYIKNERDELIDDEKFKDLLIERGILIKFDANAAEIVTFSDRPDTYINFSNNKDVSLVTFVFGSNIQHSWKEEIKEINEDEFYKRYNEYTSIMRNAISEPFNDSIDK